MSVLMDQNQGWRMPKTGGCEKAMKKKGDSDG
jgi:hypothetical protein